MHEIVSLANGFPSDREGDLILYNRDAFFFARDCPLVGSFRQVLE